MKRISGLLLVLLLVLAMSSSSLAAGFSQDADAIEIAAKSVLKLYLFENVGDKEPKAYGSGFVAFNSSTLITNFHVIDGMKEVLALDDNDEVYELKFVLCADKDYDIAILEFSERTPMKPLDLYPDDQLKRGSPVVAIGSPKEIKNTVSTGIVSSVFDDNGIPMIQITAPISPGSSGGALFNDDGKIIGITSSGYKTRDEYGEDTAAQNINFAINSAVPMAMYNAWNGEKYSIANHPSSAKLNFSNVYDHANSIVSVSSTDKQTSSESTASELWKCPNCGAQNTGYFCQECGNEKTNWICSCGNANSGKFCGTCGKKAEDLVNDFDRALTCAEKNDYAEAISILSELGSFDSGSFSTDAGSHASAKHIIQQAYYEMGSILLKDEKYGDARDAFNNAGNYENAKAKILEANYLEGMNAYQAGEFDKALSLLVEAGDYPKADEARAMCYYSKGLSEIAQDHYDDAILAFQKAGDYSDAEEQISIAEKKKVLDKYKDVFKAFESGDYEGTRNLFEEIQKRSDNKEEAGNEGLFILKSLYEGISDKQELPEALNTVHHLLKSRKDDNPEEKELFKEISYELGKCYDTSDTEDKLRKIVVFFEEAEDYRDAEQLAMSARENVFNYYLSIKDYQKANDYYQLVLIRKGYNKKCVILQPGDSGEVSLHIFSLIKSLMKKEIPDGENVYKDDYIPTVIQFERQIGATPDGIIDLEEYAQIENLIYIGAQGLNVTELLEQLCDLGYLRNLPEIHEVYTEEYVNAIKKAENTLGLTADGVVTPDEFYVIMKQVPEIGRPGNLKARVSKNTVTLTWNAVKGVNKYKIYQGGTLLGETKDCKWVDKVVGVGKKMYTVEAAKYTVCIREYVIVDIK